MQNINYPEKHVPYSWTGSTNTTKIFLQVMCELKIAQIKDANTLSTNPSIGGEGRVCTTAK